jgi:hypothetical protein
VEVPDIDPKWRKASYSGGANGSCVEVGEGNGVLVRDTTDRDGGTLTFTPSAWRAFTSGIKRLGSHETPLLASTRNGVSLVLGRAVSAPLLLAGTTQAPSKPPASLRLTHMATNSPECPPSALFCSS